MTRTIYSEEPATGWRPWGLLIPFLAVFIVAVTTVIPTLVMEQAHLLDKEDTPVGLPGLMIFLLVPFTMLGLAIWGWIRVVERRPLATIGLRGAAPKRTFLFGHLVGIAATSAIVAGIWAAGAMDAGAVSPALQSPTALASIALLLVGFALQSSVEEIVFRGWMLSAVAHKFGVVTAIVFTSITFAFLHYNPHQPWLVSTNTALFSVFACAWALRTGNIWGVMGWHAGWNWLLAVGFELRVTGIDAHLPALLIRMIPHGPDYLTGGTDGPEGSVMCTAFLLAGTAFFALMRRRDGA